MQDWDVGGRGVVDGEEDALVGGQVFEGCGSGHGGLLFRDSRGSWVVSSGSWQIYFDHVCSGIDCGFCRVVANVVLVLTNGLFDSSTVDGNIQE